MKTIKNKPVFYGVLTFTIVLSLFVNINHINNKNDEIAYKDAQLEILQEENNKAIAQASKRSTIEIIKDQIKSTKSLQKELDEEYNQSKKNKEANIWYLRCLETEGELELQGDDYDLMCYPYEYDMHFGEYLEERYTILQDFASYNLQETRNKLGL